MKSKEKQNNQEYLKKLRHSTEHVLTQAMLNLYPEIVMAMGPATDEGFYFDFDAKDYEISEDNFPEIEAEMQRIINADLPFTQNKLPVEEARKIFTDNPFKQEWLNEIADKNESASIYWTGEPEEENSFVDLCAGPHVNSTGEIKAFKLMSIAGAYWRGDEKNQMLTRIYGTAFPKQEELEDFLKLQEEAKKRDHRFLGQQLGLFMFDDEVGQGLPLWLPKGAWLRRLVQNFALDTYLNQGYEPVITPHIASSKLWKHSGHLDFYAESMYNSFGIEGEEYRLKPMNCPLHVKMYQKEKKSYRELPIRWTEMGTVYRYERSGTLHGLTRVRGFTQDDAHIICTEEQLWEELQRAFDLTLFILKTFGFQKFETNLSVRDPEKPEKFIGKETDWEKAQKGLEKVLKSAGFDDFVYDLGGAAFYGPKIDLKVSDALGRKWQLSTLQVDFNLPSRFQMTYIGADGQEHTPFMIHRALLGSLERFIGVLIEHYAGNFPLWLSPVQIKVIPISAEQNEYAQKISQKLKEKGIRSEIDDRDDTMQTKIRKAQMEKIPYMIIVGQKELEKEEISIRTRSGEQTNNLNKDQFIKQISEDIQNKKIDLRLTFV